MGGIKRFLFSMHKMMWKLAGVFGKSHISLVFSCNFDRAKYVSSHQNRKEKTWPAWHIHHHVCPKFVEISTHLEWFYLFSFSLWCRTCISSKCCFPNDSHHNTVCALCFLLHFRSKLSWLMVFVRIRVRRLTYLHWNARK